MQLSHIFRSSSSKTPKVLLDEASQRDSEGPDEAFGSVLMAVRANRYLAEPADITPPPGLVTESRGIKGLWRSLCYCDKGKDESGTQRMWIETEGKKK